MTVRTIVAVAVGIGDNAAHGMLSDVTRYLDRDVTEVRELRWPAEYGPAPRFFGQSFNQSLQILRGSILHTLETAPHPRSVALVGYSGGAAGIGDVVAELHATNSRLLDRISCVCLLADPRQPDYVSPPGEDKFGIAGNRGIPNHLFPVLWFYDPADPIPYLERHSPLRRVADLTADLTLTNLVGWATAARGILAAQQLQEIVINWRNPAEVRARFKAAADAIGRYVGPDHISYATRTVPGGRLTHTRKIAVYLNSFAHSRTRE
ncbi:hypothetical protein DW322_00830 [Rhodococcus rhodnii]|uniref:PE-PPE domain-containing protein n=2 Tax=Rhodococcus rhodnii TaxID=38312 RepID=R7WP62_9NOCA|nr:hypothetical protein [Rhodococcus rhodnii]EOM75764.1 hypothetical protein Rrhod_2906 [Rhodococcus rhodnii LMG 5362]TXG88259.1 hypothetical protein DW322_21490 [Rhodococcus rhodnii]TXG89049.1 hypothetical protein DW322_00830 [Rhodococcus rhodnii]